MTSSGQLTDMMVSLEDIKSKIPGFYEMLKTGQIFELGERLFRAYKN
jgi:hypothetical protein